MVDHSLLEKIGVRLNKEKSEEKEIQDRLVVASFNPGKDDNNKQEKANDAMAATIAIKKALPKTFLETREQRLERAREAGKRDKVEFGGEQVLGDSSKTFVRQSRGPFGS